VCDVLHSGKRIKRDAGVFRDRVTLRNVDNVRRFERRQGEYVFCFFYPGERTLISFIAFVMSVTLTNDYVYICGSMSLSLYDIYT